MGKADDRDITSGPALAVVKSWSLRTKLLVGAGVAFVVIVAVLNLVG